jgi:hypothetical protein
MSSKRFTIALVIAGSLVTASPAFSAEGSRPQLAAPVSAADEAPRPTDEALRSGMNVLRASIMDSIPAAGVKAMDAEALLALAGTIDRQVGVVAADRDFHSRDGRYLQWLLGDVNDGVALMRDAPRAPAKQLGLMKVIETLNFYGRAFDHPGWEPLTY